MSTEAFDTNAGLEDAVLRLLARCEHRLRIFDPDLTVGPMADRRATECLEQMMHRSPKAECTLLLHDTSHIAIA